MSIFGKDHYIKFFITTFSHQKMLEVNIWIRSSQQDNTEDHDYMSCDVSVVCCLYVLILSTVEPLYSHPWGTKC